MKIDLHTLGAPLWRAISDVPGWPDAPKSVRFRRMVPVLLPCLAVAALMSWSVAVHEPYVAEVRASNQDLLALENELTDLRMRYSEQQANDLTSQTLDASRLLLASPEDAAPLLRALRTDFESLGWNAVFQTFDVATEGLDPAAQIMFAPARAKLSPTAGNGAPFSQLLRVLDLFSSQGKRIDLTRLGIQADELGRTTVDVNLRLACRATHEKAAQ